jgi:hypothetical protein
LGEEGVIQGDYSMTRGKGVRSGSISLLTARIAESSNSQLGTAGINKDATAFTTIHTTTSMATLSASTFRRSQEEQHYQQEVPEGGYGDQNGTQEATIEGWRDIA